VHRENTTRQLADGQYELGLLDRGSLLFAAATIATRALARALTVALAVALAVAATMALAVALARARAIGLARAIALAAALASATTVAATAALRRAIGLAAAAATAAALAETRNRLAVTAQQRDANDHEEHRDPENDETIHPNFLHLLTGTVSEKNELIHLPSKNLASERDGTPLENTWVPARRHPLLGETRHPVCQAIPVRDSAKLAGSGLLG